MRAESRRAVDAESPSGGLWYGWPAGKTMALNASEASAFGWSRRCRMPAARSARWRRTSVLANAGRCTTSAIRSSAAPSDRFGTFSDTTNASHVVPADSVAPRNASSLCSVLASLPPAPSVSMRAMNEATPGSAPSRREPPATVIVTCTSGSSCCGTTRNAMPLPSRELATAGSTMRGAAGSAGGFVRSTADCACAPHGSSSASASMWRIMVSPSSSWRRGPACLAERPRSSRGGPAGRYGRPAGCRPR